MVSATRKRVLPYPELERQCNLLTGCEEKDWAVTANMGTSSARVSSTISWNGDLGVFTPLSCLEEIDPATYVTATRRLHECIKPIFLKKRKRKTKPEAYLFSGGRKATSIAPFQQIVES
jgi:hypothetical protein